MRLPDSVKKPVREPVDSSLDIALERFIALHHAVSGVGYRGWEFDDFLASPIVHALCFDNLLLQRIAIQVGERFPINLRPLLRVPKLRSAKADGFFARGYLHAHLATGDGKWLERAEALLDSLEDRSATGVPGCAWGNDFDFASRAGLFRKDVPTVVWTSHVGDAFALAHRITGSGRYAETVVKVGDFVLNGLERHEDGDGVCLAYAPGLIPLVHNSNMLGGVALLRAWSHDGDDRKLELARRVFDWSLAHMEPDGSFFYGVGETYAWIDNFHTAYVIDCLSEAHSLAGSEIVPVDVLERAIYFWRRNFFLADGSPSYYHDRPYPFDIQCAAQAVETLSKLSETDPSALVQAHEVLRRTIEKLGRPDGFFDYRRFRHHAIRLVSLHWGQATMLSALGCFLVAANAAETLADDSR